MFEPMLKIFISLNINELNFIYDYYRLFMVDFLHKFAFAMIK